MTLHELSFTSYCCICIDHLRKSILQRAEVHVFHNQDLFSWHMQIYLRSAYCHLELPLVCPVSSWFCWILMVWSALLVRDYRWCASSGPHLLAPCDTCRNESSFIGWVCAYIYTFSRCFYIQQQCLNVVRFILGNWTHNLYVASATVLFNVHESFGFIHVSALNGY